MFGMGFSEIVVILVIGLIFLGPDKLPQAAKSLSKGIRDLRKQTRELQSQIEGDEQIGGALRDLRSALRGDEAPRPRPASAIKPPGIQVPGAPTPGAPSAGAPTAAGNASAASAAEPSLPGGAPAGEPGPNAAVAAATVTPPTVTLPPTAGEAAADRDDATDGLADLVKPASGTVAKRPSDSNG